MKVVDPGHVYDLEWLDGHPNVVGYVDPAYKISENRLIFVKREGEGYPGNVGYHPGTNIQEVLRALIDRVKHLDKQVHCFENTVTIACLREAMWQLEKRAAHRHGRTMNVDVFGIEELSTCNKCGHVGCEGRCHP